MRILIGLGGAIYLLFAVACFRPAWIDPGSGLASGERLFALLGGLPLMAVLVASLIAPLVAGASMARKSPA